MTKLYVRCRVLSFLELVSQRKPRGNDFCECKIFRTLAVFGYYFDSVL